MAPVTGITMVKRFDYRDNPAEEWSNKYWLTGSIPINDSEWRALSDALAFLEANVFTANTHVVRSIGYNDNTANAHSVFTCDYSALGQEIPGTIVPAEAASFAGDQAGMVEWRTSRKSSRGKWIYLRKYFHDGLIDPSDSDKISPSQIAAYNSLHSALQTGTWTGARRVRSQFNDEVLVAHVQSPWVTTRTLKRRGKRP